MSAISPPPTRRNHGCLWGCLGVLVILFLPIILAGAYGTWFLAEGYRHNPVLRAVGEMVRQDGLARLVLGPDVHVTGVEGNAFSYVPGIGSAHAYVVELEGGRGNGTVAVMSHTESGRVKIDSMMLTGPDGRQYDLMHHAPAGETVPADSI